MTLSLPLVQGYGPDDPLLWFPAAGTRNVTAAQFCGAAARLARALPRARYAINRCEDPARFLLASAAALAAGHTLVLPHTRASEVQRQLRERYPDAYTLVDAPGGVPDAMGVPDARAGADAQWPPPAIAGAHVAAILFTSGSTGAPAPQPKTWSSLVRGASTFAQSFGAPPDDAIMVGTVAPQHMFGFEATALVPLQRGVPLVAARPLFPADLDALLRALAAQARGAWLLTTPLHLRAFHAGLRDAPPLSRVIVSTMPMPAELARTIERDWDVRVDEIYGCTEGGMLATRRPAHDASFTPAAGLRFALDEDGCATVEGGQLDAPLAVADRFRAAGADARLTLIGRSSELVKIAGKRSSLSELTAILQALPGVLDAVCVLPQAAASRVAAVVVAPAHDAASLRRALAARVDRVFLPRPLLFAAALPRDAQGKLARAAVLDLLRHTDAVARPDRILMRECVVRAGHPALPGHFPGQALVPGVTLLARVERLLRDHGLAVAGVTAATFSRPVQPDEPLQLRVEVLDATRARFAMTVRGAAAASGTLALKVAA